MEKPRALIVEDMPEFYEIIKPLLERFCEIDYASTKNDALKKLSENNYNFVLTDYHLGSDACTGGLDVLDAANRKNLSALLMSKEFHLDEAQKRNAGFVFKRELVNYLKENGR